MSGIGGAGKSTVFAHLEKRLRECPNPPLPVLLRIAASVYTADETERDGFVKAVGVGKIAPSVAVRYLVERVVRHMAATVARPYVLAAMVLPEVTRGILSNVILRTVDVVHSDISPADRDVFEGLCAAGWLVRISGDNRRLTFYPVVRRLVLTLMDVDADHRSLVKRIRSSALEYYKKRRTAADRTFAAYFAALLDEPQRVRRSKRLQPDVLGSAIEDLSDYARTRLFGARDAPQTVPYFPIDTENEWRERLEGGGQRTGEADRLVSRARAAEALLLYRSRPTRPVGEPPTFFIQALADNAEWETDEVNIEKVVGALKDEAARSSGSVPNALRSRLYWLTRFALLKAPGPLSYAHSKLVRDVMGRTSGHGPVLIFPAIQAVADAFSQNQDPLAPEDWFRSKGPIESETRMFLVQHLRYGRASTWRPRLDALFVAQSEWPARLALILSNINDRLSGSSPAVASVAVDHLLKESRALLGDADLDLPRFNSLLKELRRPILISVGAETEPADAVFLLRGLTAEVHQPLKAAITRLLVAAPNEQLRFSRIAKRLVQRLGLKKREFSGIEFDDRLNRNLAGAYTILIPFLDRSRMLPELCEVLSRIKPARPEAAAVVRAAKTFLMWDAAICCGRSSKWSRKGIQSQPRSLSE